MRFSDSNGPKTKQEVLEIIEKHLKAYKILSELGLNNQFLDEGDVNYVQPDKEFDLLKEIVEKFEDKGTDNDDFISEFYGYSKVIKHWTKKDIPTYQDLNSAIFKRIDFLDQFARKEVIKEKQVSIPVTESIDKNTFWTVILGVGAISTAFLVAAEFGKVFNGLFGFATALLVLLMTTYKKKFFGKTK